MRSRVALLLLVMVILQLGTAASWSVQAMPVKPRPDEATDIPAMTEAAPDLGADWQVRKPAGPMYPFLPELDNQAFRKNGDRASSLAYQRWLVRHRQWLESFRAGLVPIGSAVAPGQLAAPGGGTDPGARRKALDARLLATELEFVFVPVGPAAARKPAGAAGVPGHGTAFVGWLAAHFTDAGGIGEEPEFMGKVGLNLVGSFYDLFVGDGLVLGDDGAIQVVRVRVPIEQKKSALVDLGHFPDALSGPFLVPGLQVGQAGSNLLGGPLGRPSSLGRAYAGGERARDMRARQKEAEVEPRQHRSLIGFFVSILTDIVTAPMTYVVLIVLFCVWLFTRQRMASGQ